MAYDIYHSNMSCYLQHKEVFYTWLIRPSILANNVRFLFHRNNRLWLPIMVASLFMMLIIAIIHPELQCIDVLENYAFKLFEIKTNRKLLKYLKLSLPLDFLLHMQTYFSFQLQYTAFFHLFLPKRKRLKQLQSKSIMDSS